MTNLELLKAIVANEVITQEMEDKAQEIIAKSNAKAQAKNAKAKAKLAEENAPLLSALAQYMTEHKVVTASEIATALSVSTPKATALIKKYGETTELKVGEVKGKSGKVKAYSLA